MSKKKEGTLAVKKVKKAELAVREPQPSWVQDFDRVLEPFRLIPWDPFRGFEWPTEIELPTRIPYVDVIDAGTEYIVKAELPGITKENVEMEIGANELVLNAKSDVVTEEKGKTYLHRERAFSTFHRHIGFGESVDTEKSSASMVEGILEVKLPKLGPRPEKRIRRLTL
ncbi:MAG: Hsp20/alpha crystallin family protein [Nitrososphaerales archaeon]|jgi:HSP20 family protein